MDAQMHVVVERVKKLLALAANNPNENEAAAASAKAQEMLDAYNIDMVTVEKAQAKGSAARKDQKLKGGLYKWQRDLWDAVCRVNHCMYWSFKGTAKGSTYEHRVLGREVNVLSTILLAEYLQKTTDRLAQEWAKERLLNVFCREAIAYREGITERLRQRLAQRRWEAEAAARKAKAEAAANGTSNALTILDVADAEEDANMDFLYGEGYSARQRAATAAAMARYAEQQRKRDEIEAANPEIKAARLAAEKAADAEWHRKYGRRAYRERKSDQPRAMSYYDGVAKGSEISLDPQVAEDRRRIG